MRLNFLSTLYDMAGVNAAHSSLFSLPIVSDPSKNASSHSNFALSEKFYTKMRIAKAHTVFDKW